MPVADVGPCASQATTGLTVYASIDGEYLRENLLNAIEIYTLLLYAIENYAFSSLPLVCNFVSIYATIVGFPLCPMCALLSCT
jgi:hypothetical protein